MLTACLLASGAMGLWHTVEFFEKEKVVGDDYQQMWPAVSLPIPNIIEVCCSNMFFIQRFYATTQSLHTNGHILLHGPVSLAVLYQPFYFLDRQSVSEVNARRKNN